MNITITPETTTVTQAVTISLDLSAVEVLAVRDDFKHKRIFAFIKDLPKPVILWNGAEEYATAGVWTNESVLAQATQVLTLSANNLPWAF